MVILWKFWRLSIVGSDMMLPFNNNSQGNIIGTFMGIGQHDENQGGSVNNINIGLWGHQITLGEIHSSKLCLHYQWRKLEPWISFSCKSS